MIPIKVNVDYESFLFSNIKGKDVLNHTIEFLALFIEDRSLLSTKKYSPEYLDYIDSLTGHAPTIVSNGVFENWWGKLQDIELERILNSKITSTELTITKGWCDKTFIIKDLSEINSHELSSRNIAKSPFGMSGQNFYLFNGPVLTDENEKSINQLLKSGPVIVEPFFERRFDFSHYYFSHKDLICYENIVDSRFQYKGSVFNQISSSRKESLSFFKLISHDEWARFDTALNEIISFYSKASVKSGFSIDSFVYEEQGEFKIRFLSEVNFRRTMGRVAYELALKFNGHHQFAMLILAKQTLGKISFHNLKSKLDSILYKKSGDSGVIILSPGDTRFEMFFIISSNRHNGQELLSRLRGLLPNTEFTVEI